MPDATTVISTHASTGGEAKSVGTGDAATAAQQSDSPNPGLSAFGAAPQSLQLQGTSLAAEQVTSPTSANAPGVVNQVAYAIQYTHSSGQGMQLHLTPPDMGSVQVDVTVRDGVLSARLEAQSSSTQQILSDNLPALKESLSQQGLAFDRIDVHLAGSNAGSGGSGNANASLAQQQDQQGGMPWDQQFNEAAADDTVVAPAAPAGRNALARLTALDIMV